MGLRPATYWFIVRIRRYTNQLCREQQPKAVRLGTVLPPLTAAGSKGQYWETDASERGEYQGCRRQGARKAPCTVSHCI